MPTHFKIIMYRFKALFVYAEQYICIQSNIFVARVLHFSAFISLVILRTYRGDTVLEVSWLVC